MCINIWNCLILTSGTYAPFISKKFVDNVKLVSAIMQTLIPFESKIASKSHLHYGKFSNQNYCNHIWIYWQNYLVLLLLTFFIFLKERITKCLLTPTMITMVTPTDIDMSLKLTLRSYNGDLYEYHVKYLLNKWISFG